MTFRLDTAGARETIDITCRCLLILIPEHSVAEFDVLVLKIGRASSRALPLDTIGRGVQES